MQFRTSLFQLVELVMGRTGGMPTAFHRTPFEQQPQLQSYVEQQTVYIHKIETYSADMMQLSPYSGVPTASANQIQTCTLTLVTTGLERIRQLPIADLVNLQGTSTMNSWQPFLTKELYSVDFGKSFVTNTTDLSGEDPFAFLFGFHYSYQPDPLFENVFVPQPMYP